jgi:hypothetical protein
VVVDGAVGEWVSGGEWWWVVGGGGRGRGGGSSVCKLGQGARVAFNCTA